MKTNIVNYFDDQSYDEVIETVGDAAASVLNLPPQSTIAYVLINDTAIHELNKTYRDKDASTDVLTFPDGTMHHLGDVFISVETCLRQSVEYQHSFERELGFLAVHGLLHTLGYDHHNKAEEDIMTALQEQILQQASLGR